MRYKIMLMSLAMGGSTADSGKEKHDEHARAEQEASKPQGSF
jgi:hypothetical protein